MKKLVTLFAVGFVMTTLTGCPPPVSPSFDLPEGTYGYQLNPGPVLQEVNILNGGLYQTIFFTLDGSFPAYWDITDPAHPNWADVATLTGSIPYLDLTSQGGADLTQLTSVGITGPGPTTIRAVTYDIILRLSSKEASATYTFDPAIWNGDYTVTTVAELLALAALVTPVGDGGSGFTSIDGELTIMSLSDAPLEQLYYYFPPDSSGALQSITGDLVITDNPGVTQASIDDMVSNVTVVGSVIHCNNADDDPCS